MSESNPCQNRSETEEGHTIPPIPAVPPNPGEEVPTERPSTTSPPTLDDFQCPVCLETFIDAVESGCHHRFCDFCLQEWFRTRRNKYCPVCRTHITTIQVLDEVNATVEARLSEIMTPQQLNERNSSRRTRQEALLRPPRFFGDDEDMAARIQEEFFPAMPSEDLTWQLELDLEEAALSDEVFSGVDGIATPHRRFGHSRNRFGTRRLSPVTPREPIRGMRAFQNTPPGYSASSPQYLSPSGRSYRTRYLVNQSDESDSDMFDRYGPDPIFPRHGHGYMPSRNQNYGERNQNRLNPTTAESLEDLRSLRETIRQAEASVANQQGEDTAEAENGHRSSYSRFTRDRNQEPEASDRTMTPDQDALLAEFHQRFHQTELAFDAATMAQNQLDAEGASLREIYQRCAEAGLLDHGYPRSQEPSTGGAESQAPSSTDFTGHPSFPSYTAFLQHTYSRGIPPFTPTFDGISSPYYQTIWSTYLSNYNHHYHHDPHPYPHSHAHAHTYDHAHNDHNHTWYQRCLNSHTPPRPPTPPTSNYYTRRRVSSRAGPIRRRVPSGLWDHHENNSNHHDHISARMSQMVHRHVRPERVLQRLENELAALGLNSRVRQSVSENLTEDYQLNDDLEEAVRRSMTNDSGGESDNSNGRVHDSHFGEHQHQHFEISHDHDHREPTVDEEEHLSEPEEETEEMNVQVEIGFQLGVHYH